MISSPTISPNTATRSSVPGPERIEIDGLSFLSELCFAVGGDPEATVSLAYRPAFDGSVFQGSSWIDRHAPVHGPGNVWNTDGISRHWEGIEADIDFSFAGRTGPDRSVPTRVLSRVNERSSALILTISPTAQHAVVPILRSRAVIGAAIAATSTTVSRSRFELAVIDFSGDISRMDDTSRCCCFKCKCDLSRVDLAHVPDK